MTEDEETMHEIRIGRIFECEFCYEEFDEDSQYRIHLKKHIYGGPLNYAHKLPFINIFLKGIAYWDKKILI